MNSHELCIHGHFYQPPREDPLTGTIPIERGAAPYHNWNERINAECYRTNAELGNFENISFNVGPTLFSWLESNDPDTCDQVMQQDRVNLRFHGVGNAMAQGYNHTILPLATPLDKVTQVRWGIEDFKHRFGHAPQGMWLPETAVDFETLEVLADHGITYTILAPWQANDPQVDTRQPYKVGLSHGRHIHVFFYDQDLSTRVSFDPVATSNADEFLVNYVLPKYYPTPRGEGEDQLVMIASDGELYGHHQQFRDKFLKHLVNHSAAEHGIKITYPGLWLKEHPVNNWIGVRENTSWSCLHGVVRWEGNCACTPGGQWKASLRQSLNQVASWLDKIYRDSLRPYLDDPWELRHGYIRVLLGEVGVEEYIRSAIGRTVGEDEVSQIALLLKSQFERQRMFTSCGWFFDDFDRIEPTNNVAHAAQAVWLAYQASGTRYADEASRMLRSVKSRRTGLRGDEVFFEKYLMAENHRAPASGYLSASTSLST